MKTPKINKLNLAIVTIFVSSVALSAVPHHVVAHPVTETHHTVTKTTTVTHHPEKKTTQAKVEKVTTTTSLTPSTKAAKESVHHFFKTLGKTTLTGHQVIELSTQQQIKGQEAAMLAAIMVQTNNALSANSKLTIKEISYTKEK